MGLAAKHVRVHERLRGVGPQLSEVGDGHGLNAHPSGSRLANGGAPHGDASRDTDGNVNVKGGWSGCGCLVVQLNPLERTSTALLLRWPCRVWVMMWLLLWVW